MSDKTAENLEPQFFQFLKTNNLEKKSILLCGFEKSGNTWVRLIIYNYFNIISNGADRTLTFEELNRFQNHIIYLKNPINFIEEQPSPVDFEGGVAPFKPGFPIFYRTHDPYPPDSPHFGKIIYIYRNPLDTLISNYYFWKNHKEPFYPIPVGLRPKFTDINYFVLHYSNIWARFYQLTVEKCQIAISYEQMKEDPLATFTDLFINLGLDPNMDALKRSIAFSSFSNIKQMMNQTGQTYGNANPEKFLGNFLRSGDSGQYVQELKPFTIKKSREILITNGVPAAIANS